MEKEVPFAGSDFLEAAAKFYCSHGIDAWADKVPYYITNNTFLAEAYFQSIISFWTENLSVSEFIRHEPFYIIEFGSGPGLFSFYLLQRLVQWSEAIQPALSFVYIMSDPAEANINFWKEHPALQEFINKGVLDFALWDAEISVLTKTAVNNITISNEHPCVNALVTISNYLLDTLQHDLLRIENGKLKRGWISKDYSIENNTDKTELFTQYELPEMNFYPLGKDELAKYTFLLEKILIKYTQKHTQCNFLFPTGPPAFCENVLSLSSQSLLMLITDKGNYSHKDFILNFQPAIAKHHSMSVDVPFDILEAWVIEMRGKAVVTTTSQSVQNAGFLLGKNVSVYPATLQILVYNFIKRSSGNLYNIFSFYVSNKSIISLTDIVTCLNELQWDSFAFNEFSSTLIKLLKENKQDLLIIADCFEGLQKVANQYYYLPAMANTLANVGLIYQELEKFEMAIYCYKRSLTYFDSVEAVYYNIGTCYMALQEWEAASDWLQIVADNNPENFTARGCLVYCQEHLKTTQVSNYEKAEGPEGSR